MERSFNGVKDFRGAATRYEKRASNRLARLAGCGKIHSGAPWFETRRFAPLLTMRAFQWFETRRSSP